MDNRVHALSHEMEPKSTGTKFPGRKAFEGIGLWFRPTIRKDNFESRLGRVLAIHFAELDDNGSVQFAAVCMANDVGDGLIDGECNLVTVLFAEAESAGDWRNRAAHPAEYLRIT